MADIITVDVVPGSVDEQILRDQYGDSINYNYTSANQFVGKDRYDTNNQYVNHINSLLGNSSVKSGGDYSGYKGLNGVSIKGGHAVNSFGNNMYWNGTGFQSKNPYQMQQELQLQQTPVVKKPAVQQGFNQLDIQDYLKSIGLTGLNTLPAAKKVTTSETTPAYRGGRGANVKTGTNGQTAAISRYLAKDIWNQDNK